MAKKAVEEEEPGEKKKLIIKELEDLPGVGEVSAEKLRRAGYDIEKIAASSPHELDEIAEIGVETAKRSIAAARDSLEMGYESADKILERRKQIGRITTGSKELDALIGGGVETMSITECYGKFSSGKCVAADTPIVFFESGQPSLAPISEVWEKYHGAETEYDGGLASRPSRQVEVSSMSNDGMLGTGSVSSLYREKVASIVEISTNRGAVLKVTKRHPLLTLSEGKLQWKSSGLIAEGDYIASATAMQAEGKGSISSDDAYFLGLFVAEGTANPLSITNLDGKINAKLHDYIRIRFGEEPKFYHKKGRTLLHKNSWQLLGKLATSNSATKFVPPEVMGGTDKIIKSFLSGYIDGDGCLDVCPSICTKSPLLASQVTYLLARLGICSTVNARKVRGYGSLFYNVSVPDQESKEKLKEALSYATKDAEKISIGTKVRRTAHDAPAKAVGSLLKRVHSKLSGTVRRNNRFGKKELHQEGYLSLYNNYLAKRPCYKAIPKESLKLAVKLYDCKLAAMGKHYEELAAPTSEKILDAMTELPFQNEAVYSKLGMKKPTFENYFVRGVPQERLSEIATAIRQEITSLVCNKELLEDIKTLRMLAFGDFGWERVESMKEMPYEGYVYDLTVEGTHNFVGGSKPMLLHNSQVGFQLALNVQKPLEQGGLDGNTLFVDTESTFRPERIKQLAESAGLDPDAALKRIFVAKAINSDHQMVLIDKAEEMIKEKGIRLIVVDSMTAHFRADYIGRGALGDRQQKLNKHVHVLQKLADKFNLAVYITNQVMDNPGIMFGDPTTPIGGHVLAHAATYRIYLRKGKEEKRIARLVDSPNMPEGECVFKVTPKGIAD